MEQKSINIKKRLLYALFVPVLLLQLFLPLLPSNVSAVGGEDGLKKFVLASTFYRCIQNGNIKPHTSKDKVASGDLFHSGTATPTTNDYTGLLSSANDKGVVHCDQGDNKLAKEFLSVFGIDPIKFVCDAGYTRSDGYNPCVDGNTDFVTKKGGYRQAIQTYTGIDIGSPGAEIAYSYALIVFNNSCGAHSRSKAQYDSNSSTSNMATYKSVGDRLAMVDQYFLLDYSYTYNSNTPDAYAQPTISDQYISENASCRDVANHITKKAEQYRIELAIKAGCSEANGVALGNVLSCANGYQNSTNSSYCYSQAWNSSSQGSVFSEPKYRACAVGQGQPTMGGDPVGLVCYKQYSGGANAEANIAACTWGAISKTCTVNSADEAATFAACRFGADMDTAPGAGLDGEAIEINPCLANPTSPGCGVDGDDGDEVGSSCAIEGVGWIICPVVTFMSGVVDSVYGVISSWLEVNPKLLATDTGTYRGWEVMRNIANVGLVIVFLLIIFSQLTGAGLSNYGIKKLLPKFVVVAVLINISFFIGQLAVDVSNILGASLYDVFNGLKVFESVDGFWGGDTVFTDVAAVIMGVNTATFTLAGIAIAGAATVYLGGAGILIMVVLSALIAVLVMFLVLAARMALIVVLVVATPLALLAMILPNTSKWYEVWKKMFISLLLIYPMVAVLFGVSQFASNILVQTIGSEVGFDTQVNMLLLGLAVATVPLFMVIPIIKGSLNAVPLVGKFAQRLSKANPFGSAIRSGMKGVGAEAMIRARGMAIKGNFGNRAKSFVGGRARRLQRNKDAATDLGLAEAGYVADSVLNDPNASSRAQARAVGIRSRLDNEETENSMALIKSKAPEEQMSHAAEVLAKAIENRDTDPSAASNAAAATRFLSQTAPGRKLLEGTLTSSSAGISGANYGSSVSRSIREEMISGGMKSKNNAMNTFAYGGKTDDDGKPTVTDFAKAMDMDALNGLTDAEVASQDVDVLNKALAQGLLNAEQATRIASNPSIDLNVEKRAIIDAARAGRGSSSSAGPVGGSFTGGGTGFNL